MGIFWFFVCFVFFLIQNFSAEMWLSEQYSRACINHSLCPVPFQPSQTLPSCCLLGGRFPTLCPSPHSSPLVRRAQAGVVHPPIPKSPSRAGKPGSRGVSLSLFYAQHSLSVCLQRARADFFGCIHHVRGHISWLFFSCLRILAVGWWWRENQTEEAGKANILAISR